MQLIYRPDNGEILGVHIFGLHAADLIHEASNAIALGTRIQVGFLCQNCYVTASDCCTLNESVSGNLERQSSNCEIIFFFLILTTTLHFTSCRT